MDSFVALWIYDYTKLKHGQNHSFAAYLPERGERDSSCRILFCIIWENLGNL